MIFTRDFVTRENYWQIASLVTQKSLFTVTHALFFMSLMQLSCAITVHCYRRKMQLAMSEIKHTQLNIQGCIII